MAGGNDNQGSVRESVANGNHRGDHRRWLVVVLALMPMAAWMAARFHDACEASGIIW